MGSIFISYSRQDQAYVDMLVKALDQHGLPVWIDSHIDYGKIWPREIEKQVEACQAFILLMSPRSKQSQWVQNELSVAQELQKPIFPILLEGKRWIGVAAVQTYEVTEDKLPPRSFFYAIKNQFSGKADGAVGTKTKKLPKGLLWFIGASILLFAPVNPLMPATLRKSVCNHLWGGLWVAKSSPERARRYTRENGTLASKNTCECVQRENSIDRPYIDDLMNEIDPQNCM